MLKILQALIKIIPFLLPAHYKNIQQNGEKNMQYLKEITAEVKQKHNLDISYQEFSIKIFMSFFYHTSLTRNIGH